MKGPSTEHILRCRVIGQPHEDQSATPSYSHPVDGQLLVCASVLGVRRAVRVLVAVLGLGITYAAFSIRSATGALVKAGGDYANQPRHNADGVVMHLDGDRSPLRCCPCDG